MRDEDGGWGMKGLGGGAFDMDELVDLFYSIH